MMASDLKNEAAWLIGEKVTPLEVRPGPTPQPAVDEVVIKVAYAAVNPTDFKMQDVAYMKVEYPFIVGADVSGVVIQLGSNVTKFKVGQRVIGHCDSLVTRRTTNGGFQRYSTVRQRLVSPLPDSIPLANAVVLPLGVDTAVAGLFQQLKLPLPSLSPKSIDKTILIWGGSSSCGSCAIQLAVAAGLRVITTASRSNFAYVKSLGASEVFDYSEGDTLGRIKTVLKPGDLVFDCISTPEAQIASAEILSSIGGGLLPIVLWPTEGLPANVKAQVVMGLASGFTTEELTDVWGTGAAELGELIWHDFIPAALASGKFQAKPDPFIIKGGLSKVQEGIDMLRNGVSAKKIVIEIDADV